MKIARSTAILLSMVALLLGLTAGQASASTVRCGDTITTDTTLTADLLGCSNPALNIARRNVVLNLNGHTVSNTITSDYPRPIQSAPDEAYDPAGDLVVENGTVQGSIDLWFVNSATVKNTTNQGITVRNANFAFVTDNRVRDGTIDFYVFAFGHALPFAQVERNVVSGGWIGFGRGSKGVATDNVVTGSIIAGITAYKAGPVTISDNVANYNETGISVEFSGVEIRNNTADHNSIDGIRIKRYVEGGVVGNHTWFNGGLGINAVEPTPGTGNWAKHNGDPRQCFNVSCSTAGKPKG